MLPMADLQAVWPEQKCCMCCNDVSRQSFQCQRGTERVNLHSKAYEPHLSAETPVIKEIVRYERKPEAQSHAFLSKQALFSIEPSKAWLLAQGIFKGLARYCPCCSSHISLWYLPACCCIFMIAFLAHQPTLTGTPLSCHVGTLFCRKPDFSKIQWTYGQV